MGPLRNRNSRLNLVCRDRQYLHGYPSNGIPFKEAVANYERLLIINALKEAGGVQKKAAESLKVKPTTLHEMMKRLRISAERLSF